MRDIAISLIFAYGAILALTRPHIGIVLWTWIGLMNPHRLTYGFAYSLPFAYGSAVLTVIGMIAGKQRIRFPVNTNTVLLILFVAWTFVTTLAAIHTDPSWALFIKAFKTFFMILLALAIIQEREHINAMVWTMVLSLGYFGAKGGIFTILTGGSHRVWGPPDSLVFGNNELAVALIMVVPLMYYLSTTLENVWQRRAMLGAMLLTITSALGTQSRGALLASLAIGVTLWWKSKHKIQLAMVAVLFVPILLASMPSTWWERMDTIKTYDQDGSAMGRINAWHTATNIALDRITGAGFATATPYIYSIYSPDRNAPVLVAHSIYFQVLGDHGFIGLALYLGFWLVTYRNAAKVAKLAGSREDLLWARDLARMIQVGLTGFFVGGAFLSLAYWDGPFYLMVLVIALKGIVEREMKSREAAAVATNTTSRVSPTRALSTK